MSTRSRKPDTEADIQVTSCLRETPPRSFTMVAGAGSGKTTSLIKGISSCINIYGKQLRNRRQKIACITYTEIAAKEIWADVDNNPLVHISTIHSFLWLLVKPFQSDIRSWVKLRINQMEDEIRNRQCKYSKRTKPDTRKKDALDLQKLHQDQIASSSIKSFRYGTGRDYARGVLGHDDILKLGVHLIKERQLFRILISKQFPFIFIDESQDTAPDVIKALKAIQEEPEATICLGFFGDPMQKIYPGGVGEIELGRNWLEIKKHENFRCSRKVLRLANAIRAGGDGLQQVIGTRQNLTGTLDGHVHLFIFSSNSNKNTCLNHARDWMAEQTNDNLWSPSDDDHDNVKLLVIVHKMAARRFGFGDLYSALNENAPSIFRDGFLDGSAWPISPCLKFLIPISIAHREGRQLEVMRLLRENSRLLQKGDLTTSNIADTLNVLGKIVATISEAVHGESNKSIGDLLRLAYHCGQIAFDHKLTPYLAQNTDSNLRTTLSEVDVERDDEETKEEASMNAFLACPASQLLSYQNYIYEHTPFRTQQGVKGTEFERVLVILDDKEGNHNQFSYEKYFGIIGPSNVDITNIKDKKDTTIDRTRRLFYVCCTRATKDLAIVLFTEDVFHAEEKIRQLNIFESDTIHVSSCEAPN